MQKTEDGWQKVGRNEQNGGHGSEDRERELSNRGRSAENSECERKRELLDREQKYIIASSALPYVNRPVHVDGKILADGGVSDRIPFERGQAHYRGAQIVILTRSAEFEQSKTYDRYIAPVLYGKYPRFVERLIAREAEYPRLITRIENAHEAGDLFMIRPDHELGIGTIESDEDKLFAAYEAGLEKAAATWDALQAFLRARLLR